MRPDQRAEMDALRDEVRRLRHEGERRKAELADAQNQMAEIAASNADHIRWHREMEAKLAKVVELVTTIRKALTAAKGE